jgi:orotidine-5'-phosphate decarboxylase
MTMHKDNFADKLLLKVIEKKSACVVGLDPLINLFPKLIVSELFKGNHQKQRDMIAETITNFNCQIIDAIYDIVPAVKPQSAFYEVFGFPGIRALEETCKYAKDKGLLVILDAKRNDIGSTAEAYTKAYLNSENPFGMDVDSLTVSGYLGSDGINPFVKSCEQFGKGMFVLVKTSNPSSQEVQDLRTANESKIYEILAQRVKEWGSVCVGSRGYSSVGAVVGATFPDTLQLLRKIMSQTIFLVPGYGAQGGTADTIRHAFNPDGQGAVISASRSVLYAFRSEKWSKHFNEEEFAQAARAEVENMREKINQVRSKV